MISAKSYKKVYGAKAFQLNAKTSGTGRLTYTSSNKKVATVNKNGVVKITGVGKTTITIKAAATKGELAAIKNITVTVVPKAIANVNVVAKKAKMTVKVPGAKGVTGRGLCAYLDGTRGTLSGANGNIPAGGWRQV